MVATCKIDIKTHEKFGSSNLLRKNVKNKETYYTFSYN
jgi:hypothetical protein